MSVTYMYPFRAGNTLTVEINASGVFTIMGMA